MERVAGANAGYLQQGVNCEPVADQSLNRRPLSMKIIIIGNSGSGKSTLAGRLANDNGLAHLDLDEIAWQEDHPTTRRSVEDSAQLIDAFTDSHPGWVIEGCYASLIEHAAKRASILYFLNLPVEACVENCRNRPWEPHKYRSKEEQDRNLSMLIDWVQDYFTRDDDFSHASHRRIFDAFAGEKIEYISNRQAQPNPDAHA